MAGQGSTQVPRMLRGSVVVQRRRCGKPNCHCADGQALHETTALSYSQAGRTRTLMLDAGQLAAVRRATERYRKARAKLDAEADAGLATLITTRGLARAGWTGPGRCFGHPASRSSPTCSAGGCAPLAVAPSPP